MEVIYILLPLAVSGICFMVYKHPPIGRKIILAIGAIMFVVGISSTMYFIGINNTIVDIRKQMPNVDGKILDNILKQYSTEKRSLQIWLFCIGLGLFILLCLSFLFDDLHNKKSITAND